MPCPIGTTIDVTPNTNVWYEKKRRCLPAKPPLSRRLMPLRIDPIRFKKQ
jgi:hypothetical protein